MKLSVVLLCASTVSLAVHVANGENGNGNARGQLYSTSAVRRVCQDAQKIIASTDVLSSNVVWNSDEDGVVGFIDAKAEPYGGTDGKDLPLTTHQIVSYDTYPNQGGKQYPKIVSCKLKSQDDIVQLGIDPTAGPTGTCRDVIEETVGAVLDSLTNPEVELVVETDLELDPQDDNAQFSGVAWTNPFPPTLICVDDNNVLHIQAKSLPVPNFFFPWPTFLGPPPPGWGPEFTGVLYCHLPAAEYIRELIVGTLQAPSCE